MKARDYKAKLLAQRYLSEEYYSFGTKTGFSGRFWCETLVSRSEEPFFSSIGLLT